MRFLALGLVLIACASPKKDAYEALAREANAILKELRPAAARILAADPSDHKTIIDACMSADHELERLRAVRFDNEHVDTEPKQERVSSIAASLLDHRRVNCRDLPPHLLENCSEWCRSAWMSMIDTVETIRNRARAEGVDIVSLRP